VTRGDPEFLSEGGDPTLRGNIALHQTYFTLQPAEVAPSNASPTLIVAVDEQEELYCNRMRFGAVK
jgi:hypothetical protein